VKGTTATAMYTLHNSRTLKKDKELREVCWHCFKVPK